MTEISAKIIADSISPDGVRLTTVQTRYPRFIHAELMTHRVFSRNARSSRAVPVSKMLEEIENDPVVPMFWGKNQKGMQAGEEHDATLTLWPADQIMQCDHVMNREEAWFEARDRAMEVAKEFNEAGYHKQIVNRLLEPFMHIDVLITATEWSNFFALRDHPAAEPHIQVLAREIKGAMSLSTPAQLSEGEWHLPYIRDRSFDSARIWDRALAGNLDLVETAIKISVARCARISYEPFDGDSSIESELRRYDLLVGSAPMHASPAEHQATPDYRYPDGFWRTPAQHGNFVGWKQYRKTLERECQ